MSTLATNAITDASGGNTATINSYTPTVSNMAGRNRIINGSMVLDQRNAGASVTFNDETFPVDRFRGHCTQSSKLTAQRSTTAPAGFINSLLLTSSSAYSVGAGDIFVLGQAIEGFNVSDLGWGTANAQTVTLSFWVRSSLTGTFGGALRNSAGNRSYPFTYTISSANTFEQKTVTISGDTSGTWLTDSGVGIRLVFSLGAGSTFSGTAGAWAGSNFWSATGATSVVGTSGATFYITGVQLEAGSVATPFEHRQYGQELALCQRYFQKWDGATARKWAFNGMILGTGDSYGVYFLRTTMRANPVLITSGTASDYCLYAGNALFTCSTVPTINTSSVDTVNLNFKASGMTDGRASMCGSNTDNGSLSFNSEL
jgi:hypothetical protein